MGYTHYFRQSEPATDRQWDAICMAFKKCLSAGLITYPMPIQRESDDTSPAVISQEAITFNGIGDLGHETMHLEKAGEGRQFCKTARKPYDLAVCSLLILANHYAPGVWKISTDGSREDWMPALTWVNSWLVRDGMPKIMLPELVEAA